MTDRVGVLPTNVRDRLIIEFSGTLAGDVRWIPSDTLQRAFRNPQTREAVQTSIEARIIMQQAAEAATALLTCPEATSWPKVAQPIFDGVRQVLIERGHIRQAELIG